MFERYTENARRVVFFARFQASQYGSPYIESEHLLLGLLREHEGVVKGLIPNLPPMDKIRTEIERYFTRGERISTSVENPLSAECKRGCARKPNQDSSFCACNPPT
jgi:ATP-dependent Clp protease ATP-binding subunit ClpC